jgi:hypothetical protein
MVSTDRKEQEPAKVRSKMQARLAASHLLKAQSFPNPPELELGLESFLDSPELTKWTDVNAN